MTSFVSVADRRRGVYFHGIGGIEDHVHFPPTEAGGRQRSRLEAGRVIANLESGNEIEQMKHSFHTAARFALGCFLGAFLAMTWLAYFLLSLEVQFGLKRPAEINSILLLVVLTLGGLSGGTLAIISDRVTIPARAQQVIMGILLGIAGSALIVFLSSYCFTVIIYGRYPDKMSAGYVIVSIIYGVPLGGLIGAIAGFIYSKRARSDDMINNRAPGEDLLPDNNAAPKI